MLCPDVGIFENRKKIEIRENHSSDLPTICGSYQSGDSTSFLYARWMQMAESRFSCTPAEQRMCSQQSTCIHLANSQLVLPSCSFHDMRPATNSFSWYKSSISAGFPNCFRDFMEIPAKRLGFLRIALVPGKDAAYSFRDQFWFDIQARERVPREVYIRTRTLSLSPSYTLSLTHTYTQAGASLATYNGNGKYLNKDAIAALPKEQQSSLMPGCNIFGDTHTNAVYIICMHTLCVP